MSMAASSCEPSRNNPPAPRRSPLAMKCTLREGMLSSPRAWKESLWLIQAHAKIVRFTLRRVKCRGGESSCETLPLLRRVQGIFLGWSPVGRSLVVPSRSLAKAQHGVHDAVEPALVLGLGRLHHQRVRYWPRHGRHVEPVVRRRSTCPLQLLRDNQSTRGGCLRAFGRVGGTCSAAHTRNRRSS